MAPILIGRELEKAKLDAMLQSDQPEFLALYGRRRVVKTFLIRLHLKNHIVFDISGMKDGTKQQQLLNFFEEYLARTKRRAEAQPPTTWPEAFQYLADYLRELPPTGAKQVVFIDEMPWLDTPKSGFIPALDFFWNQHVSRMSHVLLIACGSASSWIRKNLINARGGLYNRISQRIKLSPFALYEIEQLLAAQGRSTPSVPDSGTLHGNGWHSVLLERSEEREKYHPTH